MGCVTCVLARLPFLWKKREGEGEHVGEMQQSVEESKV
jgi:hypothetical protein